MAILSHHLKIVPVKVSIGGANDLNQYIAT